MFSKRPASAPLVADPSIRRSYLSPDKLLERPFDGEVQTVGDIFAFSAQRYGDRTACYTRDVVDIVEESKTITRSDGTEEQKVWKYFTLSPPQPQTYKDLDRTVTAIVSGLVSIGFSDLATPIGQRPRVSIYADTCLNWQLMSQSFARLGHTITTAYTTLGEQGLQLSWEEPEVELCFCGETQLGMVAKALGKVERVKYVVYEETNRTDQGVISTVSDILSKRGGRAISFEQLKALGKANPTKDLGGFRPTPDDLFCIMYTSGSTGTPKGVLLKHSNLIAAFAGSIALWGKLFKPKEDLLMSYLPLAHILAQFLEYTFYLLGIPIGYASVKTLLDDSVRNCQGDFAAYRPTLIGGVPAIFEMIRKGMMKKIAEAGPVVGAVLGLAVKGKQTLPWPFGAVIDKVLFARIKQATGGRLRYAVCGGGALSKDTQLFLSTVLAPIMQGYGLTETCGMTAITTPEYWSLGSSGVLGPSTELKLQDHPDLGYVTSNKPSQGEIWIRGPNIFAGYFKHPELDAESITTDGWFKTGDIGQWEADGTLTIIDRIKHLIKLSNGEYLALDRVESIYKATDVIMMLCIAAPPYADRPVAIVYPHEGNLRHHLKALNIPCTGTPAQWTENTEIKQYILDQMLIIAKKNGLSRAEMIKDVILTPEEWSPDNLMLTPAMKLNRPFISKQYDSQIKAVYSQS